jgi:hypothetical protein
MAFSSDSSGERLFIVLGMHRSGTSALCRSLLTMGINLGSNLNPPHETNPKGHWEDLKILEFNENLLMTVGMSWNTLSSLSIERMQLIQKTELIDQARDILRSKISGSNNKLFGFKEPRTAKLLPFWQKVFQGEPYQVAYLLPFRNPLSVAQSLQNRNGFELIKSYLLWLLHVIPCLAETAGSQRILVNYDDLLEDPVRIVSGISKEFELPIDEALLHEYATEFLDKELRHARNTIADLRADSACPELVRKVYFFLEEVRLGKEQLDSEASEIKIQEFVLELQGIAPIFELLDAKYQQKIDLEATVTIQGTEAKRLQGLIESQSQQHDSLSLKLGAVEQQLQSLQNDLVVSEEQARNLKLELLNAEEKIVGLESDLAQETHSLEIVKSNLTDALQKVHLISERYERAEHQQGLSIRQLELANATVTALNQLISQTVQSNQQSQAEIASSKQMFRPQGWLKKLSTSVNRSLFSQVKVVVKDTDISNLPSDFEPALYLKLNPDVALAGFDPRRHYVLHGKNEGRRYKDSSG